MRTVSETQLADVLGRLPGEPRVVAGGNHAAPLRALAILDASVAAYRLHMLNAPIGIPDREGVTYETSFVGAGMRGHPRLSYVPSRLSLVPALLRDRLVPDVVVVHTTRPRAGTVSLGVEVNILPAAVEAVRALSQALPTCVADPGDLAARTEALYGAFLCGLTLGNATMGVHHKICHVLGGAYDLPHGGIHSAVLPYAVAYNRTAATGPLGDIATALRATDPATGLWELAHRIGAPTDLVSVGFDPAVIDEVATQVAAASPANPHPVTVDGVRDLLAAACAGDPPKPAG